MSGLLSLAQPFLLGLEPEKAHRLAIAALSSGVHPRASNARQPILRTEAFGLSFPNPLGMAAGFDKNGEVPGSLLETGFGSVEIGSVTPRPQAGNPKPRVFRLMDRKGAINRLGFNNDGHAKVLARVKRSRHRGILGINVGANKDAEDRITDYATGIHVFGAHADYMTVNISSPNTPGLRGLQEGEDLDRLLDAVEAARQAILPERDGRALPILLKVAPDLDDAQAQAIADVALARSLDGLIVSNTTISRDAVAGHPVAGEAGGLSGAPLFQRSTVMLARFHQLTGGKVPLVGVGGITSGADAWQKILAGATLVQLYTGLIYGGFGLVEDILSTLANMARREGFQRAQEASGRDAGVWASKAL